MNDKKMTMMKDKMLLRWVAI